jgi:hypothetical protein
MARWCSLAAAATCLASVDGEDDVKGCVVRACKQVAADAALNGKAQRWRCRLKENDVTPYCITQHAAALASVDKTWHCRPVTAAAQPLRSLWMDLPLDVCQLDCNSHGSCTLSSLATCCYACCCCCCCCCCCARFESELRTMVPSNFELVVLAPQVGG